MYACFSDPHTKIKIIVNNILRTEIHFFFLLAFSDTITAQQLYIYIYKITNLTIKIKQKEYKGI